jgi:predicted HicB family RNase H-like nuclease
MELFIALGRDPNKTFKGSFSVRIGRELHVKAYKATLKKEITLNQLVSKALEHEVEQTS